MTPEERRLRDARREHARMMRTHGPEGVLTRQRASSNIDATQLKICDGQQLRVLAAGNGATAEDIGKFWFVPGYSRVGGPDIIPDS